MANIQMTLSPTDVQAAITNWVQTPANFTPPVTHQVNSTISLVHNADGSIIVQLNF